MNDVILIVHLGAKGKKGDPGESKFDSALSPNTPTILKDKNIGDLLGLQLNQIIEQILTTTAITLPEPVYHYPYTYPINLKNRP